MVEPGGFFALLWVVKSQDLVAEQEERVLGTFPQHVHAELLREEAGQLRAVGDPEVDVIEPDDPKVAWRGFHACVRPRKAGRRREPPAPIRGPPRAR